MIVECPGELQHVKEIVVHYAEKNVARVVVLQPLSAIARKGSWNVLVGWEELATVLIQFNVQEVIFLLQ